MQSIARTTRGVSFALLGIVAAASALGAFLTAAPGRPAFSWWGRGILVVTSGSMSPSIRTGDVIVLRSVHSVAGTRVNRGTVVTFRTTGDAPVLVTHRVVGTALNASGRTVMITKGDANPTADLSPLTTDRIIGEPVMVLPRAGFLLAALTLRPLPFLFGAALVLAHTSVTLAGPARRATQQHKGIPEETGT